MRILLKVLILLTFGLLIFYYTENRIKENKPLEAPVKQGTAVPSPEKEIGVAVPQTSRPSTGLSTWIGRSTVQVEEEWGAPNRIEPSGYSYEWWVYSEEEEMMFGVTEEGVVNQVFTADVSADLSPFEIGQQLNDIYRFTIIGSEIDVPIDENIYTFSLNSEDMQTRMLVIYQDLYAQLYIDGKTEELVSIRFLDPETLVLHQPYDMTYMGELLLSKPNSSQAQLEVNRTKEHQLFELTNIYRKRYGLSALQKDSNLALLAFEQSKENALRNHTSDTSSNLESLSLRLKNTQIEQRKAGENIAADYVDAIEAIHGLLNSPAHREVLLDNDFTHLGTGAYGNYYAQIFIQKPVSSKSKGKRKDFDNRTSILHEE